MSELTKEEKLKLVEKLPQRLKDFLYSEDTSAFLLYIGNKYKLPDERISMLSKIVGNIILGITSLSSLGQEIISKVVTDAQIAANITQEINNNLLVPVLTPVPTIPAAPVSMPPTPKTAAPTAPIPQAPPATMPTYPAMPPVPVPQQPIKAQPTPTVPTPASPSLPSAKYQVPSTDKYRKPLNGGPARQQPELQAITGGPEIVDLRKTPPPPIQMPVTAAPIPPSPRRSFNEDEQSSTPAATPPLTFTKPIEKPAAKIEPPLIEAEPHLPAKATSEILPEKMPVFSPAPEINIPTLSKLNTETKTDPYREILDQSQEEKPQFFIRPPGLAPTDMPRDVLDLRKDKGEF